MATPDYAAFCRAELTAPYPLLEGLRAAAPVHWSPDLGSWLVTTYEDVSHALRHAPLAHDRIEINTRGIPAAALPAYGPLATHVSNWLGFTDPPKHARMREIGRNLVNPALAHKFSPWTATFVRDVVARIRAEEVVDLVEEVALRLPLELICHALGVPDGDAGRFHAWSGDIGLFAARMSPEWGPEVQLGLDRSMASWLSLEEMFRRLMDDKRRAPQDDLLTQLVHYFDEGALSEDEVIGLAVFILAAGHGTSRDLIANSLYLLLTHPAEAAKLAGGPAAIGAAVEEVLRYESPIPMLSQLAAHDAVLGGQALRAGDPVILHIGSANRDGAKFARADVFDVARADNRHLAFGLGPIFASVRPSPARPPPSCWKSWAHLRYLVADPGPPKWKTGDMSGRALAKLDVSWSATPAWP